MKVFCTAASAVLLMLVASTQAQVLSCNFENQNICDFQQRTDDDDNDWTVKNGTTITTETGPSGGAANSKFYVYFETSDPVPSGARTRLASPALGSITSGCLKFSYHMYGNDVGSLNVYLQQSSPLSSGDVIFSRLGEQGNQWETVELNITNVNPSDTIVFEAIRGNGIRSDIAIDEISISPGQCGQSESLPFSCGFEDVNICGFTQDSGDVFDWTRQSGRTPTATTGPSSAVEGTFYMFTEVSDPRGPGDNAILVSPALASSATVCLEFQYHMYGATTGTLNVGVQGAGRTQAWTLSGDQGNAWRSASVDLDFSTGNRVYFEGIRANDIQSDIAIDNVRLRSGSCSDPTPAPTTTTSTTTTTTTTAPPTSNVRLPITCGFESNFCNLVQSTNDVFDWTRNDRATVSSNTGPSAAADGSWYIFIEASFPRTSGHNAILQTMPISISGPADICVRFKYHMLGQNVNTLRVYTTSNANIFERTGALGDQWNEAEVDTIINNGDTVFFEANVGGGVFGDISLDTIRITSGQCVFIPPEAYPATFTSRTCDMENDGGSSSTCSLSQSSNDNFDWTVNTGKTPSAIFNRELPSGSKYAITGPESAHGGGLYVYVEATNRTANEIARLIFGGSDFSGSGDKCLSFFYHMNGFHMGRLRVYVTRNSADETVWQIEGDQFEDWYQAAIDINMNGISEVVLEGRVTGLFSSDMAIDDVLMSNGNCQATPVGVCWQCNFDLNSGSSLCRMQQDKTTDNFDWKLQRGRTPSRETGPDAAFDGAYYIYIEATDRNINDTANILTPAVGCSGTICVDFRYSMYGFHTGALQISVISGSTSREVFIKRGDQGQGWGQERVTVTNVQSSNMLRFSGIRGTAFSSDIALDNIIVTSGSC